MSDSFIIYETLNLVNLKIYVGKFDISGVNSKYRKNYLGSGKYFKRAVKKYGKENFNRTTIEYCTSENVNEREIFWISQLSATDKNIGYNFDIGGTGGNKVKWTKEKRRELSIKLTGENHPMFGKHHSIQTIKKQSEVKIGDKNPMFGKHLSEESKKILSEKREGENNPFYGKQHSIESKEKIRNGNLNRKMNERCLHLLKIRNKEKSKKVEINKDMFNSISEASSKLKIDRKLITYRINSKNFPEYCWFKE